MIKTAIIKNKTPSEIKDLGNNLYEVSSSTKTFSFLKFCLSRDLDSFYFLSSVPSTIGGNIAMNVEVVSKVINLYQTILWVLKFLLMDK